MTKEEMDVIADSIIADLPDTVDPRDLGMLRSTTIEMLREGYERRDVVQFLHCIENVNPDLPEDIALERMRKIRARRV
jgi:hypothetical protein